MALLVNLLELLKKIIDISSETVNLLKPNKILTQLFTIFEIHSRKNSTPGKNAER